MPRIFEDDGIVYSLINQRVRTVQTGNNSTIGSNAISSNSPQKLVIPGQVKDENGRFYRVTEIGRYSFYDNNYITSVYLPSSIEIIRRYGLAGMKNCIEMAFGDNSRLRIVEDHGLYDLYGLQSLKLTSNCLVSFGFAALAFAFKLESLTLPSSIKYIGGSGIGGLTAIKTLYYCGTKDLNSNSIETGGDLPVTNSSLEVYVSSKYQGSTFVKRSIKGVDDSHCTPKIYICYDIYKTYMKTRYISFVVFLLISLLS